MCDLHVQICGLTKTGWCACFSGNEICVTRTVCLSSCTHKNRNVLWALLHDPGPPLLHGPWSQPLLDSLGPPPRYDAGQVPLYSPGPPSLPHDLLYSTTPLEFWVYVGFWMGVMLGFFSSRTAEPESLLGYHPEAGPEQTGVEDFCCCPTCQRHNG